MATLSAQGMGLLTDKPDSRTTGALYLVLAALAYIPQMLNMVDFGTVRAMGHINTPIVGTSIGMWCVRVPIAALAAWVFKANIAVVFAGIALDQYVRLLFVRMYIRKKKLLQPESCLMKEECT